MRKRLGCRVYGHNRFYATNSQQYFLAIPLILLGLPHVLSNTPSIPYYRLKRPSQLLEGDQGQESVTHQNLVFRRV